MAIQFVGGATASKSGATSGNSTIALNSGLTGGIASAVAAGDLVIAVFGTGSTANRTLAITDGGSAYTLIGSELYQDDTIDTNLRVAYKFMGETPDTATTFGPTGNANDAGAMAVYVFRGVDPDTPLDVAAVTGQAASTSRVVPPDITPSTAGAFVVVAGAAGHGGGTDTFTSSDLTDFRTQGANDTNDVTIGIGHDPAWSSGATNYATWGHSQADNTSYCWAAMTIALRPAATTVTHATTGALAGQGAAVAGAASSATTRPSSGALTGPGTTVDGTAARTRVHATDGALAGAGAAVDGAAARTRAHATDGVLAGPGSAVVGEADRQDPGPVTHDTSGVLAGPGVTLEGTATRTRLHATNGVLDGQAAVIDGTAARTRQHATEGELGGQQAAIVGAARLNRPHTTDGALAGQGATLGGDAARVGAPVEHGTSGALVAAGAILEGSGNIGSQSLPVHPGAGTNLLLAMMLSMPKHENERKRPKKSKKHRSHEDEDEQQEISPSLRLRYAQAALEAEVLDFSAALARDEIAKAEHAARELRARRKRNAAAAFLCS